MHNRSGYGSALRQSPWPRSSRAASLRSRGAQPSTSAARFDKSTIASPLGLWFELNSNDFATRSTSLSGVENSPRDAGFRRSLQRLFLRWPFASAYRPTAIRLRWCPDQPQVVLSCLGPLPGPQRRGVSSSSSRDRLDPATTASRWLSPASRAKRSTSSRPPLEQPAPIRGFARISRWPTPFRAIGPPPARLRLRIFPPTSSTPGSSSG